MTEADDREYSDEVNAAAAQCTRVTELEIDRSRLIRRDLVREVSGTLCGCSLGQYGLACGATPGQIDEHSYSLIAALLGSEFVVDGIWHANDAYSTVGPLTPKEDEITRLFASCGVTATFTGEYNKSRLFST